MAWEGWFSFEGNELVNSARTEAYCEDRSWFRPLYRNEALPLMLGDGARYTTPLHDDAPWVDPDVEDSVDFYGFYPLGVAGLEDSTRSASPSESTGVGGSVGTVRKGMRTVVFNGLLLARTEAAAEYGRRWLDRVLSQGVCDTRTDGGTLCYLSSAPEMDLSPDPGVPAVLDGGYFSPGLPVTPAIADGSGPADDPTETLLDGGDPLGDEDTVTDGGVPGYGGGLVSTVNVTQTDSPDLNGGGVHGGTGTRFDGGNPSTIPDQVDFITATFPFDSVIPRPLDPATCLAEYERTLVRVSVITGPVVDAKRELSDGCSMWSVQFTAVAANPAEFGVEVPVIAGFLDPEVANPWVGAISPEEAAMDTVGYIATAEHCAAEVSEPLYDPLFPAAILPPAVPNVPLGNFAPPVNWVRRQITIPRGYVPIWGEVVPRIEVHARTADLRNLRLRFYADPYQIGDVTDDPCAYCGDIVISYVPRDHTLVLDGTEERVYAIGPGGVERGADSLVFGSDGSPFEWPTLTCGFGYIATFDLPQTQQPPVVDLSLFARAL